jgi:hypothetical protein
VNPRVSWAELPVGVRRRIEAEAGSFIRGEQVAAGHNCLAALIMHTSAGSWFVKGIRADHARAVWNQANEAAINPYVVSVTAPLEFRVQADGWDLLGFRYLAVHRHASLAPGSPDLPLIAATLQALAALVVLAIGEYRRLTRPAVDLATVLLCGPKLDDDTAEVFAEIEAERKADFGRSVDLEACA